MHIEGGNTLYEHYSTIYINPIFYMD